LACSSVTQDPRAFDQLSMNSRANCSFVCGTAPRKRHPAEKERRSCISRTAIGLSAIYESLLSEAKVDLFLGGTATIRSAGDAARDRARQYFVGLMGLGVNIEFAYDRFFAMIPTGTDPNRALTGVLRVAAKQTPRPKTVAIVAADAPFSKNRSSAAPRMPRPTRSTSFPRRSTRSRPRFRAFINEAQQSSPTSSSTAHT